MKTIYLALLDNSVMQSCIADVSMTQEWDDLCLDGAVLHRIHTVPTARRHGLGTRLMVEICGDADREGITLYLQVNAYGHNHNSSYQGLDRESLIAWYQRWGFEWNILESYMARSPAVDKTKGS